jgi:hypothetical protein
MALASRSRSLFKLRNQKTVLRRRMSHHMISQVPLLLLQSHNLIFLLLLPQNQHLLWMQNSQRTVQGNSSPVLRLSRQPRLPLSSHLPLSQRPRIWPIPLLTLLPAMRSLPRPTYLHPLPQNSNSSPTLVSGAWRRLSMRPNLAVQPSPSDTLSDRTPNSLLLPFPLPHRATPRTAVRVLSGAGRYSPQARGAAAFSWGRSRRRPGLAGT